MPTTDRSADDLPLAAYTKGVIREPEPAMEDDSTAPGPFTDWAVTPDPGPLDLAADDPESDDPEGAGLDETPLGRARAFARRNPRPVAGGLFVGVILVGLMLLGGEQPSPSAASAVASPGAPTTAPIVADPGAASLVLTGSLQTTLSFTGRASQPVAGNTVFATWTDELQNTLALSGPVDRGTRLTDTRLILSWGLMVDGALVTFTSSAGECTIGMASSPNHVSGSFSCRKVKSDDGKLTVGASGTYRI